MRPIDADVLKEFINEGKVCDICPNKKPNCVIHCDFPDYLTPIWEKVIDSIPTIDDLSDYSDKLWKKAYERGKAEGIKTGHWNYASFGNQTLVKCSECEEEFLGKDVSDYKFCPICGCRMIEEIENE